MLESVITANNRPATVKAAKPAKKRSAARFTSTSIAVNLGLFILKLSAGLISRSTALVSDAIHSLTDVSASFVVRFGVRISSKEADNRYPYGYERIEEITAILVAMLLFVTGLGIGTSAATAILNGSYKDLAVPGMGALVASAAAILIKEAMFWYMRSGAKQFSSNSLMADAWHHRIDAITSAGSFVGIFLARLGFPIFDSIAGLFICAFIIQAAWGIFKNAAGRITDKSADPKVQEDIRTLVKSCDGVIDISLMKTRQFSDRINLDLNILADGESSLCDIEEIKKEIKLAIGNAYPSVKYCTIQVAPFGCDRFGTDYLS